MRRENEMKFQNSVTRTNGFMMGPIKEISKSLMVKRGDNGKDEKMFKSKTFLLSNQHFDMKSKCFCD